MCIAVLSPSSVVLINCSCWTVVDKPSTSPKSFFLMSVASESDKNVRIDLAMHDSNVLIIVEVYSVHSKKGVKQRYRIKYSIR